MRCYRDVERRYDAKRVDVAGSAPAILSISRSSRSAVDASIRGGDVFHTVRRWDGTVVILLADLSSKGAVSCLHSRILRCAFSEAATTTTTPGAILASLNHLRFESYSRPDLITFATAVVAMIDARGPTFYYASAGHELAMVISDRADRQLAPTGPLLGVFDDASYVSAPYELRDGERLVLATDGVSECRSRLEATQQFGIDGLINSMRTRRTGRSLASNVLADLDSFSGCTYRDDATVAVMRRI